MTCDYHGVLDDPPPPQKKMQPIRGPLSLSVVMETVCDDRRSLTYGTRQGWRRWSSSPEPSTPPAGVRLAQQRHHRDPRQEQHRRSAPLHRVSVLLSRSGSAEEKSLGFELPRLHGEDSTQKCDSQSCVEPLKRKRHGQQKPCERRTVAEPCLHDEATRLSRQQQNT